jgi:hydroxymethylglutaryl-CoA lyase
VTTAPVVTVTEVGMRDGLQLEERRLPTEEKITLTAALAAAGFRRIEVGSFVSPKAVPSMADTGEVLAGLLRGDPPRGNGGVEYQVLVANDRGVAAALEAGAGAINVVVAATESMNQRNVRRSVDESAKVTAEAVAAAGSVPVAAIVAVAFRCPYEGPVAPETTLAVVDRLVGDGVARITLADTIGAAGPRAVGELVAAVRGRHPHLEVGFHGHDTRGLGVANALAAVDAGAAAVDASVGGLGGCPFAGKGASGNVASEEVLGMLEDAGIPTGVDVDGVAAVALELERLLGHPLPSRRLALFKATGSAR